MIGFWSKFTKLNLTRIKEEANAWIELGKETLTLMNREIFARAPVGMFSTDGLLPPSVVNDPEMIEQFLRVHQFRLTAKNISKAETASSHRMWEQSAGQVFVLFLSCSIIKTASRSSLLFSPWGQNSLETEWWGASSSVRVVFLIVASIRISSQAWFFTCNESVTNDQCDCCVLKKKKIKCSVPMLYIIKLWKLTKPWIQA